MAKVNVAGDAVRIRLESPEDVWFWERRFNVFDFLELFPLEAITEPVPEAHVPPPAEAQLTFETDAGFSFQTDIVRGGYYLRNQTQGTRRWMAAAKPQPGDDIQIERRGPLQYYLSRVGG